MKAQSNSLYARLTDEQRDQVFTWLLVENKSLQDVAKRSATEFGVSASVMAFSRLLSSHGVVWRVERARSAAEAAVGALPENAPELQRQALARVMFARSLEDLSIKELHILASMELEKEKLTLKQQELQLKREGLELRVREFERKAKETETVLTDGALSSQEKEARIKAVFGISA